VLMLMLVCIMQQPGQYRISPGSVTDAGISLDGRRAIVREDGGLSLAVVHHPNQFVAASRFQWLQPPVIEKLRPGVDNLS